MIDLVSIFCSSVVTTIILGIPAYVILYRSGKISLTTSILRDEGITTALKNLPLIIKELEVIRIKMENVEKRTYIAEVNREALLKLLMNTSTKEEIAKSILESLKTTNPKHFRTDNLLIAMKRISNSVLCIEEENQ